MAMGLASYFLSASSFTIYKLRRWKWARVLWCAWLRQPLSWSIISTTCYRPNLIGCWITWKNKRKWTHGFKCTRPCNIIITWGWRWELSPSVYLRRPLDAKLATMTSKKTEFTLYSHDFYCWRPTTHIPHNPHTPQPTYPTTHIPHIIQLLRFLNRAYTYKACLRVHKADTRCNCFQCQSYHMLRAQMSYNERIVVLCYKCQFCSCKYNTHWDSLVCLHLRYI